MIKLNTILLSILVFSSQSIAQVATIDAGKVKQYIDGFGASTAWHGQLTDKEADAAFKNDNDSQYFCKNYASAIEKPVMMPESQNFVAGLSDPTLNDSVACSNISFIGGHLYGTSWRIFQNLSALAITGSMRHIGRKPVCILLLSREKKM